MRLRYLLPIVIFAAATPLLSAAEDAPRGLTPRQLAELETVSAAEIAPDGSAIAFQRVVPRTLFEEEDGPAWVELWIHDTATGTNRPYVSGQVKVSGVDWLPDSSAVSFLAKRGEDEHTCLYLIPLRGGEAQRVIGLEESITSYAWSPDASRVALISTRPEDEALEEAQEHGFTQEIFEEDWRPRQVWVAPRQGEAPARALELEGSAVRLAWNPVYDELAVALAPTPLVDDRYMNQDVFVVALENGAVTARIEVPGKLGPFFWSPDGEHLALIAGSDRHDPRAGSLLVAPRNEGSAQVVGRDFRGRIEDLEWLDSSRLLALAGVGVESDLYQVDATEGSLTRLTPPLANVVFSSISRADDGALALVGSSAQHPAELFAGELESGITRRSDSNPWLARVALGQQQVLRYSARDGLEIEGLLITPLGFREDTRYPLVVMVHGGPESHRSNGWLSRYSSPAQVLAARGFAVFVPNYRGSTGRGVAFAKLGQKDAAGKEFDDIVDAVDHLIEMGLADPEKVGVTGGSYGGYATAWLATHYSERFAAGVMFVGISNKISKSGTTDIPQEEYLVHARRWPHEAFQFFLERSPIFFADKGRTPLLIAGGTNDTRVHPGQSLELFRALKSLGQTPVRLVRYPGEGHGNRRGASRYDYCLRLLRWFQHYLQGPGGEPPSYALEYRTASDGWPEATKD